MTITHLSAKRWKFLQLFPFSVKFFHLWKYIKCFKYFTSSEIFWRCKNFYISGNILKISKFLHLRKLLGNAPRRPKLFWNLTILKKPFYWPFYRISMNISPLLPRERRSKAVFAFYNNQSNLHVHTKQFGGKKMTLCFCT